MTELMQKVELAMDIEPELNRVLAGRTIQSVEWHDGHGDVIVFHLDDGTRFTICTTYNLCNDSVKPDPNKLHLIHKRETPERRGAKS